MITEQLTPRLKQESVYTAQCTCHTFVLDGKAVLQAYKGYFYASDPIYSKINSYGDQKEISKEEFKAELNRIKNLK